MGGSRAGQPVGPVGLGLGGRGQHCHRETGSQEGPHPGRASREEGRGQDSSLGGAVPEGTCQQRDRRSAQAPHPKRSTPWEPEGELDHRRVGSLQSPPPEAPCCPALGCPCTTKAMIAGSLAQDCHPAVPGALISPTRTCPALAPTPGPHHRPQSRPLGSASAPTWPHLLPASVQGPGY